MPSSLVSAVRGISMGVLDLDAAVDFYTKTWHLTLVEHTGDAAYLRGTGTAHHILSLHRSDAACVRSVTFQVASEASLDEIQARVPQYGGCVLKEKSPIEEPGRGIGVVVSDPQKRVLQFVYGDEKHQESAERPDYPVRITHIVFNSVDVATAQHFYENALGFKLSDRTRIMAFMRCASDHHSVALADAEDNTFNHVAFLMPDLESALRGAGRMRDAGYAIEWGVGRHGPGNNAFAYFIGPAGFVIEYTAEVQQVDDTYVAGGPDDWKWPAGRVDQWGVSPPPSDRIKHAQKQIRFVPSGM